MKFFEYVSTHLGRASIKNRRISFFGSTRADIAGADVYLLGYEHFYNSRKKWLFFDCRKTRNCLISLGHEWEDTIPQPKRKRWKIRPFPENRRASYSRRLRFTELNIWITPRGVSGDHYVEKYDKFLTARKGWKQLDEKSMRTLVYAMGGAT